MSSGERFYMMELRHRPAVYGDLGHILRIQGLVIGGEGAQAVFLLPDAPPIERLMDNPPRAMFATFWLTAEEWTDFLVRTDSPEVLIGPAKAFHRKVRYEISGHVQQKVWLVDGLKCMYCHQQMGKVQLTIDHFIPLEMGGVNNDSNYLSACKKCNKDKGSQSPVVYCQRRNLSYIDLVEYLANRKLP